MSELDFSGVQYPSVVRVERFIHSLHAFDNDMLADLPVVLAPHILVQNRYITRDGEGFLDVKASELHEKKGSYPAVGDIFKLLGFFQIGEYLPNVELL